MNIEEKEEKPQGRFKKYNYEIKEEPINEKKEEEVIEPKKNNTYFGRLSRRLLESKKEKAKEKEKEEIIEKVEEKPKNLSRYDRFSYKPKFKNQKEEDRKYLKDMVEKYPFGNKNKNFNYRYDNNINTKRPFSTINVNNMNYNEDLDDKIIERKMKKTIKKNN